jgi:hypothetical protein
VSAVFAFWGDLKGEGEGREIGFGRFCGARLALCGLVGPGGFFLRRLFDNFIGRKRDVDGGVLAGLLCLKGHGGPKRQADGHVSDNHSF